MRPANTKAMASQTDTSPAPFSSDRPLRIGTRGSKLALAQAHETRERLMAAHAMPEAAFEIVVISTTGDRVLDRSLSEIGGKGLFTKEIEVALANGEIDIAVHSTKDVANEQPDGLSLTVFLPREDVRDAFVSPRHGGIDDLPPGAVVGSSSLRRRAQLLHRRPDLNLVEFRGNVQTRLKKLEDGMAEATFLAVAGLGRLGLDDVAKAPIPPEVMLPAVAQGAISIEQRTDDDGISALIAPLNHDETSHRMAAERTLLRGLDGSCRTPIGGLAEVSGDRLHLRAEVLRPDGSERHATEREGPLSDAAAMGEDAAAELKGRAGPGFFGE